MKILYNNTVLNTLQYVESQKAKCWFSERDLEASVWTHQSSLTCDMWSPLVRFLKCDQPSVILDIVFLLLLFFLQGCSHLLQSCFKL